MDRCRLIQARQHLRTARASLEDYCDLCLDRTRGAYDPRRCLECGIREINDRMQQAISLLSSKIGASRMPQEAAGQAGASVDPC